MLRLKIAAKRILIILLTLLLVGGTPLGVSAQAANSDSSSEETAKENKPPEYKYNPATGTWDSDEWSWNPKTYETKPVSKSQPAAEANASAGGANTTANTGPGSNNQQSNNGSASAQANINNNLGVNNHLGAIATTGNAAVSNNTIAGSALSGDAQSIANIINMLQSSTVMGDQGMVTFQQDITGDIVGDLLINPELIFNLGPNSQNTSTNNQSANSSVNVNTDASVNNDVNLAATSGNATVDSNTEAGDATSGNAYVMANVVNVLNSVIAANQSFLGLINIYGNLDGDILFPPETINKLLTSNIPTGSVSINNVTGEVELNSTNNQNINNDITLDANSGNATVANNTNAGSATTGEAKTNLTVLNLTGSEVIASNSILVFVNVLGTWVGMIMDAPSGATAAALGGGVTQNNINAQSTVNATNNANINNNLNLTANTGDATVTNNNTAGSATSGNAYAAANVANINNSSLNLSNWFGLLFINVFGSWNGSFGVDTEAGNRLATSAATGTNGGSEAAPQVFGFAEGGQPSKVPLKQFVLQTSNSDDGTPEASLVTVAGSVDDDQGAGTASTAASTQALAAATQANERNKTLLLTGFGVMVGASMLGADRASNFMQNRRSKREIFAGTQSTVATDDL